MNKSSKESTKKVSKSSRQKAVEEEEKEEEPPEVVDVEEGGNPSQKLQWNASSGTTWATFNMNVPSGTKKQIMQN